MAKGVRSGRTCSMRLGPFCGPPRPACKAAHPVQDAVVDWMMSHAGEHAADAPIARPWVLVLTRPEHAPRLSGGFAPGGCDGMRMNGKGSRSLRMSCHRLIYGNIFDFLGVLQKNTYVLAWVMAVYAWLDGLWCQRDGFPNRELEVDHLGWYAADPPLDGGPSEDGGTVSGTEPP